MIPICESQGGHWHTSLTQSMPLFNGFWVYMAMNNVDGGRKLDEAQQQLRNTDKSGRGHLTNDKFSDDAGSH